jgi:probable phosphoglycerate mutase
VYASPLPRARDTAAPLCRRLDLQPIIDPRLTEFDLGSNPFEVVMQRPDLVVWRSAHRGLESGETLGAFGERVAAFCDHVAAHHLGERVAIFTHSGVIDAALRWALGIPPHAPWLHEFNIGNGSITQIDYWPQGRVPNGAPRYAAITSTGDVQHLGEHASDM